MYSNVVIIYDYVFPPFLRVEYVIVFGRFCVFAKQAVALEWCEEELVFGLDDDVRVLKFWGAFYSRLIECRRLTSPSGCR